MAAEQPQFIPPQLAERTKLPEETPLRVWSTLTRRAMLATNKAEGHFSDYAYHLAQKTLNRQEAEEEERLPATPHDNAIYELYTLTGIEHVPTPFLPGHIGIDISSRDLTLDELQQFRARYEREPEEKIRAEIRRLQREHEQKVSQMIEAGRRGQLKFS